MDERSSYGKRRASPANGSGGSLSPAVTRAVAVLDAVAAANGTATGTSELSRRLGLPKSSIANICAALVDTGLLRRHDAGFTLGRKLAELGGAYLAATDQVSEFYRACDELSVASDETIQLAALDGLEVTYVARHDGRQPIRLASEIGRRLPASCTAIGKAALAALAPDDLAERLRGVRWLPAMTDRSHRTVAALLEDLDLVRERGYAVDDEETADGVVCYGVAIERRSTGEGIYAVSVTLLKARATDDRRDALVSDLLRLASIVSPISAVRPVA